MKNQIEIGDSTRGFSVAEVTINKSGKIKLVKGTEQGRITIIKKCIANYNRGINSYVTSAGDELPFVVR